MAKKTHPLERLLREKGISQEALAKELEITGAHLSRIIHGKRRLGIDNAKRISKDFDIPLEDLL